MYLSLTYFPGFGQLVVCPQEIKGLKPAPGRSTVSKSNLVTCSMTVHCQYCKSNLISCRWFFGVHLAFSCFCLFYNFQSLYGLQCFSPIFVFLYLGVKSFNDKIHGRLKLWLPANVLRFYRRTLAGGLDI